MDELFISISALQHYAFCPRQFALIHLEQAWEENQFTAEGRLLHERVDSGDTEQRGKLRSERGVLLTSNQYQIKGKMDLLEIETLADKSLHYFPVEYKRGKPKIEDWDRIQVCAQALCIEEMRSIEVAEGAIWYWEVRRREPVQIDVALREQTISVIENARQVLASGKTPAPTINAARCRACSLVELCQPQVFRKDHSHEYVAGIYQQEPSTFEMLDATDS